MYNTEMQRNFDFAPGEYYHLYNRGVEKRNIFIDERDYERFVRLLYVANGTKAFIFREIADKSFAEIDRGGQPVAIGAWCLMPNHFHILVKVNTDLGVSEFMKKLCTGYAAYFNKRHKHSGVVFENVFKARHVSSDEYLKYLYAYIHLNPVKLIQSDWKELGITDLRKTKKYLEAFRFSSFQDYVGMNREEKSIITKEEFPEYFEGEEKIEFENFIHDWLEYREVGELAENT